MQHHVGADRALVAQALAEAERDLVGRRRLDRIDGFEPATVKKPECHALAVSDLRACSWRWPESWQVKPGKAYFLQVTARLDLFDSESSETMKIVISESGEAAKAEEEATAIRNLELDSTTQGLALASSFAQRQLFNETVTVLQAALRGETAPLLHLALGDACVKIALLETASWHYRQVIALAGPQDLESRAAAELGLGWASYLDERLGAALVHFRESERLAEEANRDELAEQASDMVERTEERR